MEMLSDDQLKIADLCSIPTGDVKKLVPNFFDKEKYVIHYENLKLYLRQGLKLKKIHCVLEFNQLQWLKQYIEFDTRKRIKAEKDNNKNGKDCLNCTSKRNYMSRKIFDNNLVVIRKSKLALKFEYE